MIPVLTGIVTTILHLKRTCPKCGRVQTVSAKLKHSPIKCEACGAEVPPPKR